MTMETITIPDFDEGLQFLFFEFLYGGLQECNGPYRAARLFETIGFLSKRCYASCIRYIQEKPMKFGHIRGDNCSVEAFMSKHRAKLLSIDLDINDPLSAALSVHVLRSCNLIELESVYVSSYVLKENESGVPGLGLELGAQSISQHSDVSALLEQSPNETTLLSDSSRELSGPFVEKALGNGIPSNVIREFGGHLSSQESVTKVHKTITDILELNAPSLKVMEIYIEKECWYKPLLSAFATRIEILHLHMNSIVNGGVEFPYDEHAKEITNIILSMSKLKRLVLRVNSFKGGSFQVKSNSLEIIDTRSCNNFYLEQCHCPSLKTLICKQRFDLCISKNGVRPVVPFTDEELMSNGDNDRRGICSYIEVKVEDRQFIGMNVPRSCTVRIYGRSKPHVMGLDGGTTDVNQFLLNIITGQA